MPSLRERIARRLFGDVIEQAAKAAAAKISIRIDDSPGWDSHTAGPADRPWSERHEDLNDALEAWRKNFLVRRIVTLTRSYVVGNGIVVTSEDPDVDAFVQAFWNHPKNHLDTRLGPMCDELTRAGELFPILFTNRADGMSYLRFVPASQIREIETKKEDYETELRYQQITNAEPKTWNGPNHPKAYKRSRGGKGGRLLPLMLHYAINCPIGATRGEGDLGPILPWVKRYAAWLRDRVRLNRQRTRQGLLDIEIADNTMVEQKRQQLRTSNPIEAGIYVHGPGEKVTMHSLEIKAGDVKDDGRALRLAIACGTNVGLHYFGEGESINYATAKEMGEPTARFYTDRQTEFCTFLINLTATAYKRHHAALGLPAPATADLQLTTSVTEVARADNEGLAQAASAIVAALAQMKVNGWIDDQTAVKMAFKFAGETLSQEQIKAILANSTDEEPALDQQSERGN